jgi:hypothetical protein
MNKFYYKKINFDRYQVTDSNNNVFCEFLMGLDGLFRFFFPIDAVYDKQEELEEILNKLKTINYETSDI